VTLSLALVILLSLLLDFLFKKVRLPGLLGMLAVGLLLGPYGANWLSPALLEVSADFRRVALVVILLRAGLMISRTALRQVGWRVLLLGLVPSLCEGAVVALAAGPWLGLAPRQALLLGAMLAAVAPAVVVPAMIDLIRQGRGRAHHIPTLLLAACPLDNVFVIVAFGALLDFARGANPQPLRQLLTLPMSLALGVGLGLLLGKRLYRGFVRFNPRATKRVLIAICLALLLVAAEDHLKGLLPFSGLMAVLALAFVILDKSEAFAHEMSQKLAKIWILAEILLFVLIGAQVNPHVLLQTGVMGLAVLGVGLAARSLGVWLSLLGSRLTARERLFCVVAYWPKATVQAVVGALALAAGLPQAATLLALAVLAIVVTAPLGAIGIHWLAPLTLDAQPASDAPVA
jgi:solute carrier family 9B (sodium/hydrogen exchanger), member 1/2